MHCNTPKRPSAHHAILFFTHNLAILIAQKPLANMKNMSDFGHKMLLKVKKIKKIGDDPLQLSTIGLPLNLWRHFSRGVNSTLPHFIPSSLKITFTRPYFVRIKRNSPPQCAIDFLILLEYSACFLCEHICSMTIPRVFTVFKMCYTWDREGWSFALFFIR